MTGRPACREHIVRVRSLPLHIACRTAAKGVFYDNLSKCPGTSPGRHRIGGAAVGTDKVKCSTSQGGGGGASVASLRIGVVMCVFVCSPRVHRATTATGLCQVSTFCVWCQLPASGVTSPQLGWCHRGRDLCLCAHVGRHSTYIAIYGN